MFGFLLVFYFPLDWRVYWQGKERGDVGSVYFWYLSSFIFIDFAAVAAAAILADLLYIIRQYIYTYIYKRGERPMANFIFIC